MMKSKNIRTRFVLFSCHMLWGIVLLVCISKYGLGVSSDAVEYLFAGLNLTRGLGLVNYELLPFLLWPPLYPVLLALIHWVTGLEMLASALVIQILAFTLLGWAATWLFLRIFPDDHWLAAVALLMLDSAPVIIPTILMVGTDYLFLALVTSFAVFSTRYIEQPASHRLYPLILVSLLAPLLRLVGVSITAFGVLVVWLAGRDSPLRRLGRSLCLGLTAIPALAWVLFTWKVTNANATRGPNPFLEDIERFSHGIANWFVSSDTINEHPSLFFLLPWVVCSSLVFFLLLVGWRWRVFNHNSMPVMGLGVVYLVFLFASARLKYVNRLVGRFTLPIYIPLILLFLLTILVFLRYVHQHGNKNLYRSAVAMCIGAFMFVNAPLMAQTRTILADSYAHGVADPNNIFNSDKANNHSVIKFWKSYPPPEDSLVFANSPAYLAFQTWEVVRASPVKYLGPYGNELLPLGNYYPDLFQPGKVTYLVWIGPPTHDYIYTPDELGQVLHLETLFENRDGGVYIITPQKK